MGTNNFDFASVDQILCCRKPRVGEGRGVLVEPYPGEGGDDVWTETESSLTNQLCLCQFSPTQYLDELGDNFLVGWEINTDLSLGVNFYLGG